MSFLKTVPFSLLESNRRAVELNRQAGIHHTEPFHTFRNRELSVGPR